MVGETNRYASACLGEKFELWTAVNADKLCAYDNSIKTFTSRRMNKIMNVKRFDSYAAIIISGTIQRQRCDACLNTVGYGKKGGLNCDGDSA